MCNNVCVCVCLCVRGGVCVCVCACVCGVSGMRCTCNKLLKVAVEVGNSTKNVAILVLKMAHAFLLVFDCEHCQTSC